MKLYIFKMSKIEKIFRDYKNYKVFIVIKFTSPSKTSILIKVSQSDNKFKKQKIQHIKIK